MLATMAKLWQVEPAPPIAFAMRGNEKTVRMMNGSIGIGL